MSTQPSIDYDTMLERLVARNEQLDRQTTILLEQLGLASNESRELAAARLVDDLPARRQVEQRLHIADEDVEQRARVQWSEITRPDPATAFREFRGQLLRG